MALIDEKSYAFSSKLNWFFPDAFAFMRNLKNNPPKNCDSLIDLSIGAPNRQTPKHIIKVLQDNIHNPEYHTYPPIFGAPELCNEVARWYKKRFNVDIDPDKEIMITIGVKEAIFNVFHALLNPGEIVLVPDPGYPTYFEAVKFCGGKSVPYYSDCSEEESLKIIEDAIIEHNPTYLIVNYPSNPTGRIVSVDYYEKVSKLSKKYKVIVLSDLAYSEIAFDGNQAGSYLTGNRGTNCSMEFFAFSKTYNMAGWRIGALIGDEPLIKAEKLYKSKLDSNVFYPIQLAAVEALAHTSDGFYKEQSNMYEKRRDILYDGLKSAGIECTKPQGAMYAWVKVPKGYSSWSFATKLYDDYGILGVPGVGYGTYGEGYVRLGLVVEDELMSLAADRLRAKPFN